MVKYFKRIFFVKIEESWFDGKMNFWDSFTFKAIYHFKANRKIWGIKQISHTLELNLEQDEQIILSNFSKAYRQQIRKAEEEGIVIDTVNDIDKFVEFFNEFALQKGTYATSKERILEKMEFLVISFAKHNNGIIAAHSYLVDKEHKIVRHYQSANKRFDNNLNKNFVGQANKFLLFTNILQFKKDGFKIFDFGGYEINTSDESLIGINNYKLKFGGKIVKCFDYYSLAYWVLKKIGKLFGSVGKV